jgi:hypothetical protein
MKSTVNMKLSENVLKKRADHLKKIQTLKQELEIAQTIPDSAKDSSDSEARLQLYRESVEKYIAVQTTPGSKVAEDFDQLAIEAFLEKRIQYFKLTTEEQSSVDRQENARRLKK